MTPHDTPPPPAAPLSNRTTPTWEMELLVSGATVFGLLQLPALADRVLFGFYNSSNFAVATLTPSLWVYVKFSLLTLIATFIVHLCLRGYWVALVGLHSVYPQGFRWDRMTSKLGPHYLASSRELTGEIDTVIERADNRASIVFGLGFGMATMMLMPMVVVSAVMVVVGIYEALGGDGLHAMVAMVVLGMLIMGVFLVLVTWDKSKGAAAGLDSRKGRWARAFFRFYGRLGFNRANNTLITLYGSNEGNRRTALVIGVVMSAVMAVVIWQIMSERLGWNAGDFAGLPDDVPMATDTLLPLHYASQRDGKSRMDPLPHIPDPVVRGNYLRLFVPYLPLRHNKAMADRCPEALAIEDETGPRARLDCLAAIHAVAIDGKPVDIHFDGAEDPGTGQRGMIAMIPVHDLPAGRHELTLLRAPRNRRKDADEPPKPHRIPFWR